MAIPSNAKSSAMAKPVLLIDDSGSFRTVIGLTLKNAGYPFEEAIDGVDALAKIAAKPFGAVVCDLNMPRMNGFDFVKRLRALPEHRFTPVLMLTTESQTAKKSEGKALGVTAWLSKPFQPASLVHAMKSIYPT